MLRPYRKSLRAVRQEFRDRLADRLGEALIIGTEARQRMVGIDVQLYASRHRNPPPRRGPHRLLDGIARPPRRQRAAALMGVTAEASSTAPTTTDRSRRFQGARFRYSRSTWSGSAWATVVMRPWRPRSDPAAARSRSNPRPA